MVSRVAHLYRQEKKFSAAEDFLLEALQKRPDAVAFYPLLAAVYEDQNRLGDAKLALERGRKQFPEDENILYYLGFIYDRTGDKVAGQNTMEKLLQLNPDNPNALNFVGYSLVEKGENLPRAKELLQRALALKPDDPFILDSYGWLLYRLGKSQEALKPLEKAAALKPEEGVIAEHLGDVYADLGMPKKALAAYERAKRAGGDKEFLVRVESKLQNVARSMAEGPQRRSQTKRLPASR
jgi:predicted Zn-dependent protease